MRLRKQIHYIIMYWLGYIAVQLRIPSCRCYFLPFAQRERVDGRVQAVKICDGRGESSEVRGGLLPHPRDLKRVTKAFFGQKRPVSRPSDTRCRESLISPRQTSVGGTLQAGQ